jgi:hypothetical protein
VTDDPDAEIRVALDATACALERDVVNVGLVPDEQWLEFDGDWPVR